MDFSQLGAVSSHGKQIDPIKLFEQLPNLPNTPNDIWRGQTEALEQWHKHREQNDVLIELNTGAGKTLVGLLIAQSLINEGLQNVIYVCATIDLVLQTSAEADKIGVPHTTRVKGGYSNDLFESGKGFCITTYHALFNGHSSIRRSYFPEAVIFDDAHVSEQILRDAFTMSFGSNSHPSLFAEVTQLFDGHFRDLNRHGEFLSALQGDHSKIVMAAPGGVQGCKDQLLNCLRRNDVEKDQDLKYSFKYLKDRIDRCAIFFGNGVCEITPPFLPSLRMDCLERPIRRVYLSATLTSKADFVRAYGRLPDISIEPKNDAGNGERLVLFGSKLAEDANEQLVEKIASFQKVVIATPNYSTAKGWAALATPPSRNDFSEQLDDFRKSSTGVFVLVQRIDGIDLPHDSCRVMVLENLPRGSSLLERFQWEYLNMRNLFATKMANRLAQLFGRINRGRNDYGVFIIAGNELNTWLKNDRNLALLPKLLQQQIKLGEVVQDGMSITDGDKVCQVTNSVLGRDPTWLAYYGDNIHKGGLDGNRAERAVEIEERLTSAALAESNYACASWDGDYPAACRAIEQVIEETLRADTLLAGWHSIWLGSCYEAEGDMESAGQAYDRSKGRLGGSNIYLPLIRSMGTVGGSDEPLNPFGIILDQLVGLSSEDLFRKELHQINRDLGALDGGSSGLVEAAMRELGELFGFESTRPDNDGDTGPDVLWIDNDNMLLLPFELKTDKTTTSVISKKDVGQGHQHQQWVEDNYPNYRNLGLIFVSDAKRCHHTASPTDEMYLCRLDQSRAIRESLLALIHDLRGQIPLERRQCVRDASFDGWSLEELLEKLKPKLLSTFQ